MSESRSLTVNICNLCAVSLTGAPEFGGAPYELRSVVENPIASYGWRAALGGFQ
jgi:hypothetical protein